MKASALCLVVLALSMVGCGGGGGGGGSNTPGDSTHLYVVSQFARAVYVYDIAADGSFSGPSRTITGPTTGLTNPISMIIDGLGVLYVVNYQTNVVVFPKDANGDVAPQTTFGESVFPISIANNGSSDYALIANKTKDDASSATVYLGSIYPDYAPPGSFITTEQPFTIPNARSLASSPIPNISTYSVWTCAGVTPIGSSGSANCYNNPMQPDMNGYLKNQGMFIPGSPNALSFRPDGSLVVANQNAYMAPSNITTWPMPGDGNFTAPTTPRAKIVGDATGIVSPVHVLFDGTSDTIYVADTGNASFQGTVKAWPADANGNVAPSHIITGLNYPFAVAVGP